MQLLYGTTNHAKLESMKAITKPLGIELLGLHDLDREIPDIEETGKTPLENARIKAKAYYSLFHIPVFSCDCGLYFEGLRDEEQPGIHVRRVGGKELSDDEMISYYTSLARQHGGRLMGRYRNAICLILNEGMARAGIGLSLDSEPFVLVDKPHKKIVPGFPLDSLLKDPQSDQYYYDMDDEESDSLVEQGFQRFLKEALFPAP